MTVKYCSVAESLLCKCILLTALCATLIAGCSEAPSDDLLISSYQSHRLEFQRISRLIAAEPRLATISQDPQTWQSLESAGANKTQLDDYVATLRALRANKFLKSVSGMDGAAYVIVYDVGGIGSPVDIRGYVLRPADATPIVKRLDTWQPESKTSNPFAPTAATAFRPLQDGWYLFRVTG
jgi:hypothetical protein